MKTSRPGGSPADDIEKMNLAFFRKPLPPLVRATIHEHYLHGRLHRGHTQADHTLCAKACMTHTQTHTHTIGAGNLAL